MKNIILVLALIAACSALPTCPNGYLPGDIYSSQIVLAPSDPVLVPNINLATDDLYNYTEVLPLAFRKVPSVAIAVNDFHSGYTQTFDFYVKYLNTQNRQNLTFVVRIDNRIAGWSKFSFNYLAEIRDDILAFSYEVAPSVLITSEQNKS